MEQYKRTVILQIMKLFIHRKHKDIPRLTPLNSAVDTRKFYTYNVFNIVIFKSDESTHCNNDFIIGR